MFAVLFVILHLFTLAVNAEKANRNISIVGHQFTVDGEPLRIVSGSLHYFRLPAAYWRDRLQKLKAAGLNAVSTYVEWSYHEPEERQYSFDGDRDIAKFIRTAEEVGLFVLLRVGPYICGERDLGGLPYWLLSKYPHIKLRTTDADFINESKIWIDKLFEQVTPLLYGNGGPIILVQIESGYGGFGSDMKYKVQMRDMLGNHVSSNAVLFTTDASSNIYWRAGRTPDTVTSLGVIARSEKEEVFLNQNAAGGNNDALLKDIGGHVERLSIMTLIILAAISLLVIYFLLKYYRICHRQWMQEEIGLNAIHRIRASLRGRNEDVKNALDILREEQGPLLVSEFYVGWWTHWGMSFSIENSEYVIKTLSEILDYGASVNFYMFFGGTNFEYTAGAKYHFSYGPYITSYDYDSPLTEAGDPTPKYFLIRDKLKQYNFSSDEIEPPKPSPKGAYGLVNVTSTVTLLSPEGRSQLGKQYADVMGPTLPTFEALRQRGGLVLYETTMSDAYCKIRSYLHIKKPRDLIFVFVDGVFQGRFSRLEEIYIIPLDLYNNSVLSLLVENQGRISHGYDMLDFKGILSTVVFDNKTLDGEWRVTGYPLESFKTSAVSSQSNISESPTFYEGHFTLPSGQEPLDTFIDTTGWGKGYIWINGHNLGRYWPSAGPQITLYLPGVWLKPAPEQNHLQILELHKPASTLAVNLIDHPILNRTNYYFLYHVP